MVINADDSCGNGWICEHRWPAIAQMVRFSIVSGSEPVENWWDNGANQIAFSRGSKGFLAVNNDGQMTADIQSGLSPGLYCDVASGIYTDRVCTGRLVTVRTDSKIYVNLPDSNPGMMALHAGVSVHSVPTIILAGFVRLPKVNLLVFLPTTLATRGHGDRRFQDNFLREFAEANGGLALHEIEITGVYPRRNRHRKTPR